MAAGTGAHDDPFLLNRIAYADERARPAFSPDRYMSYPIVLNSCGTLSLSTAEGWAPSDCGYSTEKRGPPAGKPKRLSA